MSYSLAHILSAKIGMLIIDNYGYQTNWFFMGTLGIIGSFIGIYVLRLVKKEKMLKRVN
jgi:uncharacterized membrane protein YfcA